MRGFITSLLLLSVVSLTLQTCPEGEVKRERCGCQQTCENLNQDLVCAQVCIEGCHCQEGQVRNSEGVCIDIADCYPGNRVECDDNEMTSECCEATCNNYQGEIKCIGCEFGCKCKPGLVRHKDECIPQDDCKDIDDESEPDSDDALASFLKQLRVNGGLGADSEQGKRFRPSDGTQPKDDPRPSGKKRPEPTNGKFPEGTIPGTNRNPFKHVRPFPIPGRNDDDGTEGNNPTDRTRPDGARTRPDGPRRTRPDGPRTRPNGARTRPEGAWTRPDGPRTRPDETRTRPPRRFPNDRDRS